MSNDVPPAGPAEPDPFDELLRGFSNEPAAPGGEPEPDLPPTEAMPITDATEAYAPPVAAAAPTTAYRPDGADETPTVVLGGGAPPVPPGGPQGPDTGDDGRRRVILGVLIAVAAVLVLAIVGLVLWLVLRDPGHATPAPSGSATSSSSPTPSETPSETPSPTPTPVAIEQFTAKANTVACPYDKSGTQQVLLSWSVTGATQVAVASAAGEVDATQQPYQNNLPAQATDFSIPYACSNAQWAYTLTVVGEDGATQSAVITIIASYAAPPAPATPSISAFGPTSPTIDCTASPNTWKISWVIANLQSTDVVNFGISNPGAYNSSSLGANGALTSGTDFPNPCDSSLASQTYYLTVLRGGNQVAQQSFAVAFTY